jgi:hypothetical protein
VFPSSSPSFQRSHHCVPPPSCSHIFIPYALVKVEFFSKFSSLEINFQFKNIYIFLTNWALLSRGMFTLGPNKQHKKLRTHDWRWVGG